jgi:hypothetical protein
MVVSLFTVLAELFITTQYMPAAGPWQREDNRFGKIGAKSA